MCRNGTYNIQMFKKYFILLFLNSVLSISYAESLNNWSKEDLCRWLDAVSIPDPIIVEIEARDLVCLKHPEIIKISTKEAFTSDHGTVFPSPSIKNSPNNNLGTGIRFIFNYKFTL